MIDVKVCCWSLLHSIDARKTSTYKDFGYPNRVTDVSHEQTTKMRQMTIAKRVQSWLHMIRYSIFGYTGIQFFVDVSISQDVLGHQHQTNDPSLQGDRSFTSWPCRRRQSAILSFYHLASKKLQVVSFHSIFHTPPNSFVPNHRPCNDLSFEPNDSPSFIIHWLLLSYLTAWYDRCFSLFSGGITK